MKRNALSALLVLGLAAPAPAQQLLAWPIGAANAAMRIFLPGMPMPHPIFPGPGPRPLPVPTPGPRPMPTLPSEASPVTMTGYHVEGTITDQVAELSYRIVFRNPTDRRLEGVLMVPLPADASLSGFSMVIGGKETKGELLEATQASSIYQSIVSRAIDPGLLELIGERMFRAKVFPIEPRGEIVATLKMTQTLAKNGGLVTLSVPMRSARFTQGEGGRASARIALKTTRPLRTILSSNSDTRIVRDGEHGASISYEEGSAGPQDLALTFSMREDPLAAGVLAYRESGEDGTFLLTLSPKIEAEAKAAPKAVVFVVDRSGSMTEGGKMDQARKALTWCVDRLNPQDRFGVVDFATDWSALEEGALLAATPENKARAKRYIERIEAAGGTNIEAGLDQGLKLLNTAGGITPMLFFLTDGVPTIGQTDPGALLRKASQDNAALRARIFSFGVGSDVNTLLLDKLAEAGRGARDYVAPNEDIEAKVSSLYQKVSHPALTDVKVEWQGVEVDQVFPKPVPDLFHGGELALYGRFRAGGKGTVVVTGKANGKPARFEFPVEFPSENSRNAFLPRLWASQKIGHELDLIRLSGRPADPEVVSSIVRLAKKHGIVTPYTSFLVTEEGTDLRRVENETRRRFDIMARNAASSGFGGGARVAAEAQADSMLSSSMGGWSSSVAAVRGGKAGSFDAAAAAPGAALGKMEKKVRDEIKDSGRTAVETRTIGGKTFYDRGGTWVDADAEAPEASSLRTVPVAARSAAYFELLSKDPGLARYFALGSEVTVLHRGIVYKVSGK
ncbi:MAG: VIT domain-containing protein [Elusimicrobia bacterium]|nr:VIT domain-containing protein [Elusimicrobiota bacterium]